MKLKRVGEASQEARLLPTHPLVLTAAPAQGGRLSITINNPTGAAILGRVCLLGGNSKEATPVTFAAAERRKVVSLPAHSSTAGEYSVQLTFEELSKEGAWETTLTSPPVVYAPYETLERYTDGSPPPSTEYTVEPDGDPKVKSVLKVTVDSAPPGLPGANHKALRIDYQFDPGWKFLRLAPHGAKHAPLAGKPSGLGMWVYGDGSGDVFNMRYTDSSGQTFQTTAGTINWKGWKFVVFSLNPENASHWGGDNSGRVQYPISLDIVALVDSPGGRGGSGRIWLADITLMRNVESEAKH